MYSNSDEEKYYTRRDHDYENEYPDSWGRWMVLAMIALALVLGGCATITNGTQQAITFAVPEDRVCAVSRLDGFLGSVQTSSPTITVERNRHPITLDCGDSVTVYTPEINAAGYTSIGLIDFGLVDSITGAMWEYGEVRK